MDLRELYSLEANKLSFIYHESVSWAIENSTELWKDLCKQDDKLYSIKFSSEGKELELRVELEKLKVILGKIKIEYESMLG